MTIPFVHEKSEEKKHPVFALTPLGKQKADAFAGEGPKLKVLCVLSEQGPCTVSEVSRGAGLDYDKATHIMKQLMKEGFIERAN